MDSEGNGEPARRRDWRVCALMVFWAKRGENALFDGICAMCGALLYGAQNRMSAISNKCSSPPINRDGIPVCNADGGPKTNAQPPFLLRWSPHFCAK